MRQVRIIMTPIEARSMLMTLLKVVIQKNKYGKGQHSVTVCGLPSRVQLAQPQGVDEDPSNVTSAV